MQFAPQHPVPVFPLPGVVLFPHTMIPLHVFELRYRTLVREALSGERLITMALLKPGWERDYHGSPEFFPLGCLARFEEVEWLPNDCYDLRLLGLTRVRIDRVVHEYPYRAARVNLVLQEPYSEDDPLVRIEKRALIETCGRWAAAGGSRGEGPAGGEFGEQLPYEALVNAVCMCIEATPREKFELLQMDSVIARGQRIRGAIERRLRKPEPGEQQEGERN